MNRKLFGIMLLTIVAGISASAQLPVAQTRKPPTKVKVAAAPDLRISEYVFTLPRNDQEGKMYVVAEDKARQGNPTARSGVTFALVAARFKNGGGNNNLIKGDKVVLVHVLNSGSSSTTACRLLLTVLKINGIEANRQKVVTVGALAPRKDIWVLIDATGILPKNVGLEPTSFKLNVDATNLVGETNEDNNEATHNQ